MSHNYVVFGEIGGQKNDVIMALDCTINRHQMKKTNLKPFEVPN